MFFESPKTDGGVASSTRVLTNRFVASVVVVLLASGCTARSLPPQAAVARPRVVATTTVVADLVRQVAGDRVVVECLMAAGIDPHSYRPTPRDADRLATADLVVASGLRLEGKLADILERFARSRPVVSVGDALPADSLIAVGATGVDPHVWFDARLWARGAPVVANALAAVDAQHADEYRANAEAYAARLATLDDRLRMRVATIPESRRVLVTAHDAFRYFGRAYGIEVVGVQGTSTESEAGLADINRLVDLVVSRGIPAVFIETSVSDRSVAAIREGARARGHDVRLGGMLYSDSLGSVESGGGTLEAALESNVESIVTALGAAPVVDGGVGP